MARRSGARKPDWNRIYELEMEIWGHYYRHLGAPSALEHPAFHPAVWAQALLADVNRLATVHSEG